MKLGQKTNKPSHNFQNLVGQRFGKLQCIKLASTVNATKWLCKCDCGNEKIARADLLKRGHSKSCGCLQKISKKLIDLTGLTFGNLTVLGRSKNQRCRVYWQCQCICSTIVERSGQDLNRQSKITQSCGCVGRVADPILSSARYVWKKEYLEEGNDLPFDDFLRLTQQTCFYCGALPNNKCNMFAWEPYRYHPFNVENDLFIYNGLDRIDSSKGHSLDNVVTCCKWCNISKRERSVNDFLKWIEQVYNFKIRKNE